MAANNSGIEMQIRYTSNDGILECKVDAFGLGRYQNRYYVIAYSHYHNEHRTFKVAKI